MATLPSSSPPSSPPSASNSKNSATQPTAHPRSQHQDVVTDNGIPDVLKKIPDLIDPFEQSRDMNSEDHIQKFNKYEADYTRRLMAKYFSYKDIYGGNIFEEKMTIDGETIQASRWPGTRSYADPAHSVRDLSSSSSNSTADTTNIVNGKHPVKKEG